MKSETPFDAFLKLSAEMTGYSETDLLGTGLADSYYETFTEIVDESICLDLWRTSNKIWKKNTSEEEKEAAIRRDLLSDPKFGPIVRSLIKLWYLGQWNELPGDWRENYGNSPNDVNFIVSPDSYKQGLVWDAIKAHPMGAKQPGFATWSGPPDPPDDD